MCVTCILWTKYIVRKFPVLTHDEYLLLKKIKAYKSRKKNNHNWIILSDDFITFTGMEDYHICATLEKLHKSGLIQDTASLIDTSVHSVCITNLGNDEIKTYKKKKIKKFLLWFIPVFIAALGLIVSIINLFI